MDVDLKARTVLAAKIVVLDAEIFSWRAVNT
jgi:hypothetical protein